jgi:Zn-dependent M28 family amino/carboxypeptidase
LLLSLESCILGENQSQFNGEKAFEYVNKQLTFGPRIPGGEGHEVFINWAINELLSFGWHVQKQNFLYHETQLTNIIAEKGQGTNWIVLGAHYDSRKFADHDPIYENRQQPVLGANDGASGVAILLELAEVLKFNSSLEISLVFFDGEDQGQINDWDWIIGSSYYVSQLINRPSKVIIIDMVGDKELNIYRENTSDQFLTSEIWKTAGLLGYNSYFIDNTKYTMIDDHTPFLSSNIPASLIIDFDYGFWHTTKDTIEQISPLSLRVVGATLQSWISHQ